MKNSTSAARALIPALLTSLLSLSALAQDTEELYQQYCAACHDQPVDRTPSREALIQYNANALFHALDEGIMQAQAAPLDREQKIALAELLGNGEFNRNSVEQFTACADPLAELALDAPANWNGWGNGLNSRRYQSPAGTRINRENLDDLQIAWSLGFEDASSARAQPAIVDGVMFVGSSSGQVHALDLETGCRYWSYAALVEVRTAPTVTHSDQLDQTLVIVADLSNRVYALDAHTGFKVWHADPDDHPFAMSTGAPSVYGDRVYVPISSIEVAVAADPQYSCCTFRGNVAALDLHTGEELWQTYIMEEPGAVGENSAGNPVLAPSGAPIWNSPTIDPERDRIYTGTGQNYSRPASDTSDSVIAFNMESGNMDWVFQATANDAFIIGCGMGGGEHPNCPDPGPDIDIGTSPLLVPLSNGSEVLVAGTKGSEVYGLDPDQEGAVLWRTNVGRGSPLGGVHWGMTWLGDTVFVPVSDRIPGGASEPQPGLHAIDMRDGTVQWYAPAQDRCQEGPAQCGNAYSAPPTAIDGVVFTGALNGVLFAHDAASGEILWEFDSRGEYDTVNRVPATGGALDAAGPVISGDYLVINSGYASFGQLAGNSLIVLKLTQ